MLAESATHGSPLALFICLVIVAPVVWMVVRALIGEKPKEQQDVFKQPKWAKVGHSQPGREISDEVAGQVQAKIERFRSQHRV